MGFYSRKALATGAASVATQASDSMSIDAFGRWRVSNPTTIFDSKQIFDNMPLFWDDTQVSGSGTTSTYTKNKASTSIGVALNTAGKRVRQTKMSFNYQPGKSQLILMTANLDSVDEGVTREVGQFDDDNGLFFRALGTTMYIVRRTKTSGTAVDVPVVQADWNVDKMDGTGVSGITIDPTKTQIMFIDYEWLGVGRVRMGFVIDGLFFLCHEILNANSLDVVYMSTPNLPLRYSIENDGTGAASTLQHICSTVITEGGVSESGVTRSYSTGATHIQCNISGTIYALCGIKLQAAKANAVIDINAVSILVDTNDNFEWSLRLNPTLAVGLTYADETNSVVQAAIGEGSNPSTSTVTGGTILASGFSNAAEEGGGLIPNSLRLGQTYAGVLDEIVLCAMPLGSNADIHGSISWREFI